MAELAHARFERSICTYQGRESQACTFMPSIARRPQRAIGCFKPLEEAVEGGSTGKRKDAIVCIYFIDADKTKGMLSMGQSSEVSFELTRDGLKVLERGEDGKITDFDWTKYAFPVLDRTTAKRIFQLYISGKDNRDYTIVKVMKVDESMDSSHISRPIASVRDIETASDRALFILVPKSSGLSLGSYELFDWNEVLKTLKNVTNKNIINPNRSLFDIINGQTPLHDIRFPWILPPGGIKIPQAQKPGASIDPRTIFRRYGFPLMPQHSAPVPPATGSHTIDIDAVDWHFVF